VKSKIPGCYNCGHAKIPGVKQCPIHRRAYEKRYRRRVAAPRQRTVERRSGRAPETDAERLYREEKGRRAERLASRPEMLAARESYTALLAREKELRNGGRPRSTPGKPMLLAVRNDPTDLLPYLGTFTGRSS
jgi:hypothetical protein